MYSITKALRVRRILVILLLFGLLQLSSGRSSLAAPVSRSSKPGSKNSDVTVVASGSDGQAAGDLGNVVLSDRDRTTEPDSAADSSADGSPLSCFSSGDLNWLTKESTYQTILKCTMYFPESGSVFITANGSLGLDYDSDLIADDYEAKFRIGINDNTVGEADTERTVNIYDDFGVSDSLFLDDGTDKSIAVSVLKKNLPSGVHTFYFLGRRSAGLDGGILLSDPTLSVIFIPGMNSGLVTCEASLATNWTTSESTYQEFISCPINNITVPGVVFIVASGSVSLFNDAYEAAFAIDIDVTNGDVDTERVVNVDDDLADGTDKSVAISVIKPVTADSHIIYFLGKKNSGAGTVQVDTANLAVLYIPAASTQALTCDQSGDSIWVTTNEINFDVVYSCNIDVPEDSWAFISADGWLDWDDGPYEANFRLGIDSAEGSPSTDRWVNIYHDDDSLYGTDETVALSLTRIIRAGMHTFSFLGMRYDGTGNVRLRNPTLSVIVIPSEFFFIYLPLILK